jgi:hypothetical protein
VLWHIRTLHIACGWRIANSLQESVDYNNPTQTTHPNTLQHINRVGYVRCN